MLCITVTPQDDFGGHPLSGGTLGRWVSGSASLPAPQQGFPPGCSWTGLSQEDSVQKVWFGKEAVVPLLLCCSTLIVLKQSPPQVHLLWFYKLLPSQCEQRWRTIGYYPFLPQSFFKFLFTKFSIKRTREISPRPPFLSSQGHGSFVTSRNLMSYPYVCVLPVHNISYFSHLLLNFFFPFSWVVFIHFVFVFVLFPIQEQLCLPLHILEEKGLTQVAVTVQALLELAPPKQQPLHHLSAV